MSKEPRTSVLVRNQPIPLTTLHKHSHCLIHKDFKIRIRIPKLKNDFILLQKDCVCLLSISPFICIITWVICLTYFMFGIFFHLHLTINIILVPTFNAVQILVLYSSSYLTS